MKKIFYFAIGLAALSMAACQKDNSAETLGNGGIVISASVNDQLVTRATDLDELRDNAQVKIYKPAYTGLIRQYTYSSMPSIIILPATSGDDKYRVDVLAGEVVKANPAIASFDSKSYKGSAEFSITAGQVITSPITVAAKICNAISNVTFGKSIDEAFESGYKLTIGLNSNNLEYTSANAGTDGYFIVADDALSPKLEWSFSGTLKKNGEPFTKSGNFEIAQSKKYTMNLIYTEKDGTLTFKLMVDKSTTNYNDEIIFEPLTTGIILPNKSDNWGSHVRIGANIDATSYDPEKIFFEYRKQGEEEWMRTTTPAVFDTDFYYATISGLEGNTTYECQLVVTNIATSAEEFVPSSKPFKTSATPAIPNASFEEYNDSGSFDVFYTGSKWWDCGNQTVFGVTVEVTTSSTDIPNPENIEGSYPTGTNTRSIRMKSAVKSGTFAAGNIYSGVYGGTNISTMSGSVNFGRPFDGGRPSALRLYVKYTTGYINEIKNQPTGITLTNETKDRAQIKVALGVWDPAIYKGVASSPVNADTSKPSEMCDYAKDGKERYAGKKDKGTIAYGTAIIDGAGPVTINDTTSDKTYTSYNSWNVLTIPIVYYDTKTIPTHIIISATSSAWGDYMSGSTDSDLYIDALELIYDSNVDFYTGGGTE